MPAKFVRSVSLTHELTALIDGKVASGHYRSASEVVRAALRLLAEQDQRSGLSRKGPVSDARDVR
jgi:antitoxin ParD1/3/4